MKMFLTRLGFGSKIVITGDVTQVDLPRGHLGLKQVRSILEGVPDLSFVELTGKDVVRHKLVQRIVNAYEKYEEARASATMSRRDAQHQPLHPPKARASGGPRGASRSHLGRDGWLSDKAPGSRLRTPPRSPYSAGMATLLAFARSACSPFRS